ncbi:3-oxo-isoapionate kinase [Baekduia alba]|uniref:four-carbon acid sugar kinase family protein n=1 Tax=Baekduia alba TaxID=2997333 RepID=UPI00233F9A8E|nr:four-carbon acid sugar kinase family protein [Baekduia alba]WCB95328.1 3-oxo-isoapionate kinase [Baekduia alba]
MSPERPLVAWYGDDMTGSIDVLEGLAQAGLRAVLNVAPPDRAQLERYPWAQAVGWAGSTRTLAPAEVRNAVSAAAEVMLASGARLIHYKICSTFDSSSLVGSIGAAIDAAQDVVCSPFVAVMPAAPRLGRWCAFSNLFARSGGDSAVFRLDRHPTMRAHPVTPMAESDVRRVLAAQSARPIGDLDLVTLNAGRPAVEARIDALADLGIDTFVCDTTSDGHLRLLASVLCARAAEAPLLVVGSSGLEHGLADALGQQPLGAPERQVEDVVLAVCGSRSPVTDRQIARAARDGWVEVALDLTSATRPEAGARAVEVAAQEARAALEAGTSVVVHTAGRALGDGDEAIRLPQLSGSERRRLGTTLGAVARHVLARTPVRRLAIAGGDSSGDVLRELGAEALEIAGAFAPAMPFCRLHGPAAPDGVEVICKGGQTGSPSFFEEVRLGRPTIHEPIEVQA